MANLAIEPPTPKGDTLADVVKSRMESTMDGPAEMKAEIARVKAQLAKLEPVPR